MKLKTKAPKNTKSTDTPVPLTKSDANNDDAVSSDQILDAITQ